MATAERRLVPLPIDPAVPDIVAKLAAGKSLVLQASPGSGKTTRIPPALLDASFRRRDGKILVLEPRRLAAKYAARRVAEERGTAVGEEVGYHFRLEKAAGGATRLLFLTEGMLIRRLLADPELADVDVVILDEFHERHLHTDVALAALKALQGRRRQPLRLVVMSATLDTKKIAAYLDGAPVVTVEGKPYPVEISHLPAPPDPKAYVENLVRAAVSDAFRGGDGGDCLVFLPGMGEIRRCETALAPLASANGWAVFPLHGELSREEQDAAIRKGPRRKIVLATNVAETSLTIDGVTVVIDSGLHRQASYSWWSGVPSLKTRTVSRASAVQRAGRAGRTAPGRCLRLYTKGDFDGRPAFEVPEIHRADLAQTFLEVSCLGTAPEKLPWFEMPPESALKSARELLDRLGAVEGDRITETGRRLAEIPAHPRLAKLLLEGDRLGVLDGAATLAALITDGRLETLDALDGLKSGAQDPGVRRSRDLLLRSFPGTHRLFGPPGGQKVDGHLSELAKAVLFAFSDRVARKRDSRRETNRLPQGQAELVFAAGGSARVSEQGVFADHDTFVALDVQEQKRLGEARAQLKVWSVVPIREEWLFDVERGGVEESEIVWWDDARERVAAASRLVYGQLVLTESAVTPHGGDKSAALVLGKGLGISPEKAPGLSLNEWLTVLAKVGDREAMETSLARVQVAAKHLPELDLRDPSASPLFPLLVPALEGVLDLKSLRQLDWADVLFTTLTGDKRGEVERNLPVSFPMPSGRKARIHYSLDKTPWLESKLQDFCGLKGGPAVAKGRLPLTLHLLAPNGRAVQVTTDLPGFWVRAYPAIRKELSRKYPRHPWPEDTSKPVPAPPPRRR